MCKRRWEYGMRLVLLLLLLCLSPLLLERAVEYITVCFKNFMQKRCILIKLQSMKYLRIQKGLSKSQSLHILTCLSSPRVFLFDSMWAGTPTNVQSKTVSGFVHNMKRVSAIFMFSLRDATSNGLLPSWKSQTCEDFCLFLKSWLLRWGYLVTITHINLLCLEVTS